MEERGSGGGGKEKRRNNEGGIEEGGRSELLVWVASCLAVVSQISTSSPFAKRVRHAGPKGPSYILMPPAGEAFFFIFYGMLQEVVP